MSAMSNDSDECMPANRTAPPAYDGCQGSGIASEALYDNYAAFRPTSWVIYIWYAFVPIFPPQPEPVEEAAYGISRSWHTSPYSLFSMKGCICARNVACMRGASAAR
jgi:hypothetical protein